MKLCIISHTEHYVNAHQKIVSWGATATEINHLTKVFDEIYHIAMFYDEVPPASALPYTSDKIKLVKLPVLGGKTLKSKLEIVKNIPKVIKIVNQTLNKVDCFQLRCPTGIGVFLIPYLSLFARKQGWYKYAGNWSQTNPPLGYALQRFFLKNQKRLVTINGKWHHQPKQCLTFENPTLIAEDVTEGLKTIADKNYAGKINFCFVGRLERAKGVETILKSINNLKDISRVGSVHLVGEGKETAYFKKLASLSKVDVIFHGGLPRTKVFEIYKASHVFLLPSTASEGFPKVIAEALCFGCLPLVSNVSSITQYIKDDKNGLVVAPVTVKNLTDLFKKVLAFSDDDFKKMVEGNTDMIQKFTFKYYNQRIKNEIIPTFK